MATFSQFKSKYITEVKKPLYGDSLDKNIIKKVVTDPIEKNKNKIRTIDKRIQLNKWYLILEQMAEQTKNLVH